MKPISVHPKPDEYTFEQADAFVNYGAENNLVVIGHTLVWHSQCPRWFFFDSLGNEVSKDTLLARMKKHIYTVVGRYKGKVHGWDVVNEAIEDTGTYRESWWYKIAGKDFILKAFEYAHEADPDVELYYNDYNMSKPGKRETVVALIKEMQSKGIRIDGVGMQSHLTLDYPELDEYEKSLKAFADCGVKVHVTEMDQSILPWPSRKVTADISFREMSTDPRLNPYPDGLPDSASVVLTHRFFSFFKVLIDNSDVVDRVTVWGVTDGHSWKNNFPIRGRKDYALLFDREYNAKPIVDSVIVYAMKKK